MAQLNHDNIVRVLALTTEPPPLIVLEYIAGGSLYDWLRATPKPPPIQALLLYVNTLALVSSRFSLFHTPLSLFLPHSFSFSLHSLFLFVCSHSSCLFSLHTLPPIILIEYLAMTITTMMMIMMLMMIMLLLLFLILLMMMMMMMTVMTTFPRMGQQSASGLWYLADHGVVHRDVAARNVLIQFSQVISTTFVSFLL